MDLYHHSISDTSRAEKIVEDIFIHSTDLPGFVIANISSIQSKNPQNTAQADFVLLTTWGLWVIEVKGITDPTIRGILDTTTWKINNQDLPVYKASLKGRTLNPLEQITRINTLFQESLPEKIIIRSLIIFVTNSAITFADNKTWTRLYQGGAGPYTSEAIIIDKEGTALKNWLNTHAVCGSKKDFENNTLLTIEKATTVINHQKWDNIIPPFHVFTSGLPWGTFNLILGGSEDHIVSLPFTDATEWIIYSENMIRSFIAQMWNNNYSLTIDGLIPETLHPYLQGTYSSWKQPIGTIRWDEQNQSCIISPLHSNPLALPIEVFDHGIKRNHHTHGQSYPYSTGINQNDWISSHNHTHYLKLLTPTPTIHSLHIGGKTLTKKQTELILNIYSNQEVDISSVNNRQLWKRLNDEIPNLVYKNNDHLELKNYTSDIEELKNIDYKSCTFTQLENIKNILDPIKDKDFFWLTPHTHELQKINTEINKEYNKRNR